MTIAIHSIYYSRTLNEFVEWGTNEHNGDGFY